MKKIIGVLVVAFLCAISAESMAQIVGIKGGLNFATIAISEDGEDHSDDVDVNTSYHAGITVEFPLGRVFSFETGALLSVKGYALEAEDSFEEEEFTYNGTASPIYVEVPLLAKLYFDLGGARLFAAAGPYAGYGVAGKYTSEVSFDGQADTNSENLKWGSDEDADFNRLDYGVMVGAGLNLGIIELGAAYGYGLANILPEPTEDFTINNRVLSVSASIKFGGR